MRQALKGMKENQAKSDGLITRRKFLAGSIAALGLPVIVPSSVFGADAPSNRITFGAIGVGRQCMEADLPEILGFKDVQVVAVSDVDDRRLGLARRLVEKSCAAHTLSGVYVCCHTYRDFRELLARQEIDAVLICTPDHWHAIGAIEAAKAGKDIFLQKPLTYSIEEGRVLSDTVRRHGRILQAGTQQRSDANFRFACELVRNGRIGKLHTIKVGLPTDPSTTPQRTRPVPKELDYDFWLGPAPWAAYTMNRVHPPNDYGRPGWLRVTDYCLGMITAWGTHHIDIAQWGMGTEYTGPFEIEAAAEHPRDGLWDVHGAFRVEYTYASGVKVICTDDKTNRVGVLFEGGDGWVFVTRGAIDANPKSVLDSTIGPNEIRLYRSNDHKGNLLECIRSRRQPIAPVEIAHRSCTACILGYIAMRTGRKLRWDADNERFIGDDEANRMISRPMRPPWQL